MLFNYFMPNKIYFGKDVVLENKHILKDFGKKAYIITGKRSSKMKESVESVNGEFNLKYLKEKGFIIEFVLKGD